METLRGRPRGLTRLATGQSNRTETEDELIRDMLLSGAGQINAVGGLNGKIIAVLKSFLIDLDPEVALS